LKTLVYTLQNIYYIHSPNLSMVLQYKLKTEKRWKDYLGKDKLKQGVSKYDFRLLTEDKKKVLVDKGNYTKVMKRFRQIEFFKSKKS